MNDMPPSEERRIPVTVLTGFLGSGKTTLLNRILTENHGKRIAVIENEFGEIGIDDALVINAEEEIFEMNNGCICCTVRGDLIRILGNLMRRRSQFDYILVETTGLADPAPVAQTFFVDDEVKALLRLDGIVTLVDARHVWQHLETSTECQEQIAFADVILLNKIDLVTPDELAQLETRIRAMNAMARIHRTRNAEIAMDHILNVGGFDLDRALTVKPTFLETEYPFEWAGVFNLEAGYYQLQLADGPDPSMRAVLCATDSADEAAIRQLQEQAAHWFSNNARDTLPEEDTVQPSRDLLALNLGKRGVKKFNIRIEKSGPYLLFTEHLPMEFDLKLVDTSDQPLSAVAAAEFNPGHTHDDTVTSVGIERVGDLNGTLLNAWMSRLLREKGVDIFRMKGIVSVEGEDRRFVFQGVHMLLDGTPDRPWLPNEPHLNQLVFIGRNLDREELEREFDACLVKAPSATASR